MKRKTEQSSFFSGLSPNTFLLAFASLFSDISTEMLYPIMPIFLTQYLHAGGTIVGLIDGVSVATQNVIQGFSGWLSDKLQKRKPIALVGYTLAALSKLLIGLSITWPQVLAARFLDRVGAGSRSAPRDALIAASATEKSRGKAFGLEGIGDNLGAFLGPIVAAILLFIFHINIRSIFYLAVIPGLLSVLMILTVKEHRVVVLAKAKLDNTLSSFPKKYWKYLLVTAIFGIGNSSNMFLILQTKNLGIPLEITILVYAIFNLVAALSSYPSGALSDKFGRKNILLLAFIIFLITYAGFSFTTSTLLLTGLFILYGMYQGIFRAVGKAYATDFIPTHLRASGIGWYAAVVGLSQLFASLIAGQLWDHIGHQSVFLYGTISALLGSIALVIFV